jgi:EmrB/QacA subfamily drug resistance transporter
VTRRGLRPAYGRRATKVEVAQTPRRLDSHGVKSVTPLLLCVAGGSFMTIFDGAAVQMTLPVIQRSIDGSIQEVEWTMTAFLLVSTSTLLSAGRAGDVLGRDRVWRAGIFVFVIASALCAVAPSLWWLVAARAAQGLGAALTTANSAPILVDAFPSQGGRLLGLGNIALALGMVSGPPLGALLTGLGSWRLIFAVAIPIGSAILFASRRTLPVSGRSHETLEAWGGVFSVLGLGLILLGGTFGRRWGWLSARTLVPLVAGSFFAVAFVVRESRAAHPIVQLSLLRQPMFVSGLLCAFFGFAALFISLAVLPYLLVVAQGRHLAEAGVLVGVLPLVLSLVAPVAGAMTDRIGSRFICTASLLAMAAAFVVILMGGSHVGAGRLIWALALAGAGLGGFEAPNDVDVLRSLPRNRLGAGTAMIGAVRNLGMTFGVAGGATLLDYATAVAKGDQATRTATGASWALAAAAASAGLGALCALIRPSGPVHVARRHAPGGGPQAAPSNMTGHVRTEGEVAFRARADEHGGSNVPLAPHPPGEPGDAPAPGAPTR